MALLKTRLHHVFPWEAKSAGVHLPDVSGVHSSQHSRYFWPWSFIYNLVSVVYCSSGQSTFGEQCKTAFGEWTCMYMDVYICTHWRFPAFRESSLIIYFSIWFRRSEPGSPVLWFQVSDYIKERKDKAGGKTNQEKTKEKKQALQWQIKLAQELPAGTESGTHFSFQTSWPESQVIFHCLAQNPSFYAGTMSPFIFR